MHNKRLYILSLAFSFLILASAMATSTQQNSTVYVMHQTAYITGNTSDFPVQPIPDFSILTLVFRSISIVTLIVGLLKWLSWKRKHGKSRTPIVLRS